MAYTEQEKEQWLEIAQDTGESLERTVPILPLNEMDKTVSIPGVVFPNIIIDETTGEVTSLGKPSGYAQLPLGTLVIKTKAAADAATAANNAAQNANTKAGVAQSSAENADEKAALANEKAGQAQTAANLANEKAEYAQTQGNYAKQKGDEASLVDANLNGNILTVKNRNGSSKSLNVKGEKGEKGDGIDYSTLTPAEKQALVEQVSEEIAQQQGYVLYPIEEGSITPTSMFRKNSIISINGVIYRAKQDTYNLPLPFVIEGERFVVQTLYGRTAFVAASNTVSNDWTVWADASNDIRFRQLEDRIARLESIIK